jgi:hypothetical protein
MSGLLFADLCAPLNLKGDMSNDFDDIDHLLEEDEKLRQEQNDRRRELKRALWVLAGVSKKYLRGFMPTPLPEKHAEETMFEYRKRLEWIAKRRAGTYVALNVKIVD